MAALDELHGVFLCVVTWLIEGAWATNNLKI